MRTLRRLAASAALGLAASAGAAPVRAQVLAPPDGSQLKVYLLTMGQGEAIWERFGHNALVIRDLRTNVGTAWNWGLFDFAAPDFLTRFLTGDTRYWMAGDDFGRTIEAYRWMNRTLWLQELAIPDSAKVALAQAVAANAVGDAKYYRYDYFLDNCSTRVRDALDRAIGGALRAQLARTPAGTTFRRETERLLEGMPLAAVGVDIALGRRADAPLSQWEAAFVPMNLREALRAVRVPDGAGGTRSLLVRDDVLFVASRPPEAANAPRLSLWTAVAGLALATLLGLLGRAAPASGTARGGLALVGGAWSLVAGVIGLVLLLAATVTRHVFWGMNANLLLFSPLSLVLAALVPLALLGGRGAAAARGVAAGVVLASAAGGLAAVLGGQPFAATLALAAPVHAALYWAVRRATLRGLA
ncbi:MAG: DUF4105 domain-containing protein [Gemmatimonadota bacterium]